MSFLNRMLKAFKNYFDTDYEVKMPLWMRS
jgi:hypothetical protein